MIGQTLGSYRIVEQIGLGGMATVYKAYDPATDRYVAVKVLPEHYSNDPHFKKRFEREAKAIARLEHPHILPVHAFGEQDGITYLVMRYMPTGTLKDRLEVEKLPLEQASAFLTQVADALDYAHEHGILHRDVKPSNILLDGKGNAYLTDFGIAKMVEASVELTGAGILGTPAYMSPEQCRGGKEITPASDQYALGVVLYEMVTGRTPFQAETPLALVYMQLNDPLPPPRTLHPDVPEGVEKAILKALSKTPSERFPSCVALADAFARTVTAEVETRPSALTAPESLTFDETAPPARLRPTRRAPVWLWPLVATLLLAGLVGGAIALGLPGKLIPSQPAEQAGVLTYTVSPGMGASPQVAATTLPGSTWIAPTRPPLTPTPTWSLLPSYVYDDFNDRAIDGSLNSALWGQSHDSQCRYQQSNGVLAFDYATSSEVCISPMKQLSDVTVDELGAFEAQIRLSSDFNGQGSVQQVIRFATDNLPQALNGPWWAECGLSATEAGATITYNVENHGAGKTDYAGSLPAEFDRWYTFRLMVDPTTMAFSCYVDGNLIQSVVPSDAEGLRAVDFQHEVMAWRGNGPARVTSYVDNIRIFPGAEGRAAAQTAASLSPSDPTLYDDFDNPAFDGSFDPHLWMPSEFDTMFQQDGMLVIQYTGSEAWQALRIEALEYSNRQLDRLLFFEADLMLSPDVHAGNLSLMPEIYAPESLPYHQEVHCGLSAEPRATMATMSCFDRWNMGPDTFDDVYNVPGMYVGFGTWHTARIEIDPTTMTITYYLDGQRVGSHTLVRTEQLKSAKFRLVIEMFKPTTEGVIGFVDNVRIGYFNP